jgi:hypothetical protein
MPPEPTVIDIDEELANRLRDAQQAYDEVAEYLTAIKDEVKHRFADYENVKAVCGDEEIFTCVRRTSIKLDSNRLKREYPEIWSQYAKSSTATFLSIKRLKADS